MIGLHALLVCSLILPFGSQPASAGRAALNPLHRGDAELHRGCAEGDPVYGKPESKTTSNAPQESQDGKSAKSDTSHLVLEGRVSCLDENGQPIADDKECSEPFRLVLHSQDGATHSFVSNDALSPMLADTRVRQRLLRITAVQHLDGQLETLTVQSIKDGKVYDIYYFCQVCNITTYTPGPCPCCRQELEFKEAPAAEP